MVESVSPDKRFIVSKKADPEGWVWNGGDVIGFDLVKLQKWLEELEKITKWSVFQEFLDLRNTIRADEEKRQTAQEELDRKIREELEKVGI